MNCVKIFKDQISLFTFLFFFISISIPQFQQFPMNRKGKDEKRKKRKRGLGLFQLKKKNIQTSRTGDRTELLYTDVNIVIVAFYIFYWENSTFYRGYN